MRKHILASALTALALLAPAVGGAVHAQAPATQTQATHSRLLPLEGGQNFRELGGYRTRDGHTVRWGKLYRSGAMDRLTDADFLYLSKLGIRTICDFRSTEERQAAPVRWPAGQSPKILADDYRMDTSGFDFRAAGSWTGDQARAAMAAQYPRMLERFNSQYRRMFAQLLAGDAPLTFNCSAGKDRTGVAAALLLTALDVPRETVIEDYLLSNTYFDPRKSMTQDDPAAQAWKRLPPGVLQAIMGVDRGYIEGVFKVIDAHPGGAAGYLRDDLGLSRADLLTLRRLYTTR